MITQPIKSDHKTLSSQIHTRLPTSLRKKEPITSHQSQIKDALLSIYYKRDVAQNKYQQVISGLQEVVANLLQRNEFVNNQREEILKENAEIRKNNDSLTNIIEVKQRLGESVLGQNAQIFEIIVENGSIMSGQSKIEKSEQYQNANFGFEDACHILNKQEFVIHANSVQNSISQNEQNQISMSNIGKTQIMRQAYHINQENIKQNIFIQCSSTKTQGIIRAFYLSIIQRKNITHHLIQLIQDLKNDSTTIIYEPYPTNQFWTEMLCNFLRIIHEGHFDTQMLVLQYLKAHRLIDTLLVKCLKSRIQFLFYNSDSFDTPSVNQLFGALSNEFNLRMQIFDGQYVFYTKEEKDQNLLLSQRASLQISMNRKGENIFYLREEQPSFVIYQRDQCLQISFFIVIENDLGLSQYQIQDPPERQNNSFRYSQENDRSINCKEEVEIGGNGDHLAGIACILNEKDMNIFQIEKHKLQKKPCKRRYQDKYQTYQQPLSSSRFFLNRVASKRSNFDENCI